MTPPAEDDASPDENAVGQPWTRRSDETEHAFRAFALYRGLGPERSLSRVAEAVLGRGKAGKKPGKGRGLASTVRRVERWSSQHEWAKRVAAWDAEVDRVARKAELEAVATARKKHVLRAERFQDALAVLPESFLERLQEGHPDREKTVKALRDLDPAEHARLVIAAARTYHMPVGVEMRARGAPQDAAEDDADDQDALDAFVARARGKAAEGGGAASS